jgi:hypothetical protein
MTANERAIVALEAEARRRGLSYGYLVWILDADEVQQIIQSPIWAKRRKKLTATLRGEKTRRGIRAASLKKTERRKVLRLCEAEEHADAVREYLLTSDDAAKEIAQRHHISTSTLYRSARRIYEQLHLK